MKKYAILIFMLISGVLFANDKILGYWYNSKDKNNYTAIIKIEKNNNEYFGIIYKLKKPLYENGENKGKEKMDLNNKNEKLRNRKIEGIKIIEKFKYDEINKDYRGGTIYNPEDGKVYYSYIKFKNENLLSVKGSIDPMGLFSKTRIWSRVEK